MKHFFCLSILVCALLCSCSNSNSPESERNIKNTEVMVYSGGHKIDVATRAQYNYKDEVGYSIPDDGRYLVYYYIRIDGNIPGEDACNFPATDYFPRTKAGKTMISDLNHGFVLANVDWKSNKKFSKYIYSTDGEAVRSIIVEEPTLEDMIKANQGTGDDFSGFLAHKDELHFLWYICKKQDSDHIWHIDGILTSTDRNSIYETVYADDIDGRYPEDSFVKDNESVVRKGHVEIDVHQQNHKDWNEIKTSIHVRDTVGVELFLPIGYEELADDFNIRAGVDYEYVTEDKNSKIQIGEETFDVEVSITHMTDGIHIKINPNREALIAARRVYGDGITFEVHSYVSQQIAKSVIWDKIKQTTCTTTPYTTLKGQITSALFTDRIDLRGF